MKVNDDVLKDTKIIELELTIKNLHTLIFFKDKEIESLKERVIFWNEAHNDLIKIDTKNVSK